MECPFDKVEIWFWSDRPLGSGWNLLGAPKDFFGDGSSLGVLVVG
jgi:hypothetical protein